MTEDGSVLRGTPELERAHRVVFAEMKKHGSLMNALAARDFDPDAVLYCAVDVGRTLEDAGMWAEESQLEIFSSGWIGGFATALAMMDRP